jgi:hypothetical protein
MSGARRTLGKFGRGNVVPKITWQEDLGMDGKEVLKFSTVYKWDERVWAELHSAGRIGPVAGCCEQSVKRAG